MLLPVDCRDSDTNLSPLSKYHSKWKSPRKNKVQDSIGEYDDQNEKGASEDSQTKQVHSDQMS